MDSGIIIKKALSETKEILASISCPAVSDSKKRKSVVDAVQSSVNARQKIRIPST